MPARFVFVAMCSALLGCQQQTTLSAPSTCALPTSADACLRCQASACSDATDSCYGVRLRMGLEIPAASNDGGPPLARTDYYSNDPRLGSSCELAPRDRCKWNDATQAYDKECVYDGGSCACDSVTQCVLQCGCGSDCVRGCTRTAAAACSACIEQRVAPCAAKSCAAECGTGP